MIIVGIETSCDETSVGIIKGSKESEKVEILTNVVASSLPLHAKTGGIIPEIAAREQIKYIIPTIEKTFGALKNPKEEIDAIAVTIGPGLIGSLLVGVETARTISYLWKKPLIGVNHLFGHIYANWIKGENDKQIEFPVVALIVSGGHTDLVLIKNHGDIKWLGGTRDDAAGEAFDKTGRLLNLTYPGGPQVEKMALGVSKDYFNFPRALIDSSDFDFSFSGLKTAVLREVEKQKKNSSLSADGIKNICYSLQLAIFDVLLKKTIAATKKFKAKSIVLGGGVAANQTLKKYFKNYIKNNEEDIKLFIPPENLCTDNGAMIAASGFFNYEQTTWEKITANPELYFD